MPELNEAQIKAALAAARSSRRRYADFLLQSRGYERERRVAELRALFDDQLAKRTGCRRCDAGASEAIHSRIERETRRYMEKQKAGVVRLSPRVRETLQAQAASRRRAMEHLLARGGDVPILNFVAIDQPALVIPTQDLVMAGAHIVPWNSSAKVRGEWDTPYADNGSDELSFIFAWENPSQKDAVVNVDAPLILNGYCDAYASGGLWAYNLVFLGIDASLDILEWWNQPPTSPPSQAGQMAHAATVFAFAHGIYVGGDPEAAGVQGYYNLNYNLLVVPPRSVIVFSVSLVVNHTIEGDGQARVDFASGDFEVVCPDVLLQILT